MEAWRSCVRAVTPYVPGEQPRKQQMIKLNTNENPYPPSPKVEEALWQMDAARLRLYPDPKASELVAALARRHQVEEEQVFVGVGSDDVLALSFLTFFNSGRPVLFPDVTYSFYKVWAELYRIPYEAKRLDGQFRVVKEDYFGECGGIVLANPNAPTGVAQPLSEIREILSCNRDVIVIVDEAYIDFGGDSAAALIDEYDNLLVVQTFSKSRSMAGARIGFALGQRPLISCLSDVKYSFNSYTMNMCAISLGVAALEDEPYFRETCERIIATRERVKGELKELGFHFPDSMSNFIFATHPRISARELFAALREDQIYVRYFDAPRTDDYLRITVGTDQEMDIFLTYVRGYLENNRRNRSV